MICAVVSLRIGCCEFYGSAAIVLEVQTFWDVMLYLVCVVLGRNAVSGVCSSGT